MHAENSWKHMANNVSAVSDYYQLVVHGHVQRLTGHRSEDYTKQQVRELELFFLYSDLAKDKRALCYEIQNQV